MASIRKRGAAQWEVRVRKKGQPTTCKTFETRADAERWAREIEGEIDRGVFVPRGEAESTSLAEALNKYIKEHVSKLSKGDKNSRHYQALAIKRRKIASKVLAAIRSKDIADYIKEREEEGVKASTIRADLAIISTLFNLAIRNWGMESLQNPVARVNKPKLPKGRERRLEEGEETRLLAVCDSEMQNIILFALETAMRRGELATLTWNNLDLERRTATLYETKNGETRTTPLSPKALTILKRIKGDLDTKEGRVFKKSTDVISIAMRKACQEAKINDLHFHDLRHEATSRLFENTDLDIMEIRSITGHKTLQMLVRYTHLRTARLADRLAGAKREAKSFSHDQGKEI